MKNNFIEENFSNHSYGKYLLYLEFENFFINTRLSDTLEVGVVGGTHNQAEIQILKNLGLDIGFRSTTVVDMNMKKINNSKFEIAREDHTNILKGISL